MPLKWDDVARSDLYKKADKGTRENMVNAYFDTYIKSSKGFNPEWETKIKERLALPAENKDVVK